MSSDDVVLLLNESLGSDKIVNLLKRVGFVEEPPGDGRPVGQLEPYRANLNKNKMFVI